MAEKRIQVTITLPQAMLDWIDSEIESKRFANRSHAIEYCIFQEQRKTGNPCEVPAVA